MDFPKEIEKVKEMIKEFGASQSSIDLTLTDGWGVRVTVYTPETWANKQDEDEDDDE